MSFVVLTTEQRTDAWRQARVGRVTGSRVADMLSSLKIGQGEAAGRRNLRVQLVLEQLTGIPHEEGFQSKDMLRGIEMELEAFAAYEARTGEIVRRAGFLAHPELMAGCSVDGQIGTFSALIELKVPKSATHLGYLRSKEVPSDYLAQVRHCLWITGAEWCDFVSYDPRFPEPLRLLITRVTMPDVERKAHELNVRTFLAEVEREREEVQAMAGAAA